MSAKISYCAKRAFFLFFTRLFCSLFLSLLSRSFPSLMLFSFFGYSFSLQSLKRTKASPAVGDAVDTHSVSPPADRALPLPLPLPLSY